MQLFRNILGRGNCKNHINFWLGKNLGLSQLDANYSHIKEVQRKIIDVTPELFKTGLNYIQYCYENHIFTPSEATDLTTKLIYSALIEDLPPPVIENKHPDKDWSLVWKRLQNGVFSPESRSFLYLLAHERVGTRKRGNVGID